MQQVLFTTSVLLTLQRGRGFIRTCPCTEEKVRALLATDHSYCNPFCLPSPSLLPLPSASPSLLHPLPLPSHLLHPSPPTFFLPHSNTLPPPQDGYGVMLDHRHLRTPLRKKMVLPSEPLALAVAQEWNAQEKLVQPQLMHLVSSRTLTACEPGARRSLEVGSMQLVLVPHS